MLNRLLGILPNASEHGVHIDQMLEFAHWKMLVLFVGWSIFFIYVMFRFHRSRSPKANYYGAKTKATTHLEISVVIVEAVLLVGFAFPLWAKRVNAFPVQEAEHVRVIGQQFLWYIHHPGPDREWGRQDVNLVSGTNPLGLDFSDPKAQDDVVTTNTFSLPVNKPAILDIMSRDVIHNVAIHHMRISQDAIPGQKIPMWFTPVKTGEFEIVCGQLCGLGHYAMRGVLNVVSQEDYESWLQTAGAMMVRETAPQGGAPADASPPAPAPAPAAPMEDPEEQPQLSPMTDA